MIIVGSVKNPRAVEKLQKRCAGLEPQSRKKNVRLGVELNDEILAKANELITQGSFSEAHELLNSLPSSGNDALTHYNLGSCLLRLGRYEESLVSLQQAIELDSEMYTAYHERGMALDELNRYQEALEHYDRTLEIEPASMDTWMNRGNTYRALGQYEKSLDDYQQAIALAPHDHLPRFNRAQTLKELAFHQEALQEMERVVQIQPVFGRGWYELGMLQKVLKTGQDEASYQKACQLDPSFLEYPYDIPHRGPIVGVPPASMPPSATESLPTDEAGRLLFLIQTTADCFASVLPILTRETLFSQMGDPSLLEELAMAFSFSATYFAGGTSGISNWMVQPDFGQHLSNMGESLERDLALTSPSARPTVIGTWLVSQFVETAKEYKTDCTLIGQMIESAATYAVERLQGRQHDPGAVDWNQRHQDYQQRIEALGDEGLNYALDLDKGFYYWTRDGQTLALANMIVLGILGGDGSFLGGWACPQASGPARPPIQMGLIGEMHNIAEEQAWEVVTRCAERLSVDYIETRATGNIVMFLGLTDMRPPSAGEEFEGFEESHAAVDVCTHLLDLRDRLQSGDSSPADLASVYRSYADSIQQSGRSMFRDTPAAVRLVETGERIKKLGNLLGKKELFLLSPGSVPEDVQKNCLQELNALLNEWGASAERHEG
jgi:tetratricopeptide (TPR) repeat protein